MLPLAELGRPRIDVMLTLSGIFRDLLPLQTRMLAEACWLAASADEAEDMNFVRKHALAHMAANNCDLETAALRVFSNADGAYGSNVNNLVESGRWQDEDELAETYTRRKGFAYGRGGRAVQQDYWPSHDVDSPALKGRPAVIIADFDDASWWKSSFERVERIGEIDGAIRAGRFGFVGYGYKGLPARRGEAF